METLEKRYTTLFNNITYALEKFEDAQKQIAEGMLLLKSSQIVAEEMYIKDNKTEC